MKSKEVRVAEERHAAPARLIAGWFAALALAGCGTTSSLVVDDDQVSVPSFRVAISTDEETHAPSKAQTGHAIEFSYLKTKGMGNQSLMADQPPIVFQGTTFTPPQQLKNRFDFNYADISWRWRKFFRERSLGLELSVGIGRPSLDLSISSPTQQASGSFATYGPQGGVGLIGRSSSGTSFHAHVSGFVSRSAITSDDYTGVKDFVKYDLFLSQPVGDNLALRAGFSKLEMRGGSSWLDTSGSSDLG
jgi:hypothetical protein